MSLFKILNYILVCVIITFHYVGLLIINVINWLKNSKYYNPILILGLSLYIHILYRLIFRSKYIRSIDQINFSELLLLSYILTTLSCFVIVVYSIYRLCLPKVNNIIFTKTNPILIKLYKISLFYNKILKTTFFAFFEAIPWTYHILSVFSRYFTEYLYYNKFTICLLLMRYGIPLFLSFCFALDIFIFHGFMYFPRFAILYTIPLLIQIIIYMLKETSSEKYPYWTTHFNIIIKGINVTKFELKQGYTLDLNEEMIKAINSGKYNPMQEFYNSFSLLHKTWYRCTMVWEELYIKDRYHYTILISRFFTYWIFFCSWLYLTIYSFNIYILTLL